MSSDDAQTIRVNFGKPLPIFPLDGVVLFPHALLPLHIFEPRYRQMVDQALDAAGQIAMATFSGDRWKREYHANPPVRPAVCIGQIVQHEKLPDGRYNLLVQGVCRAQIEREFPVENGRLYRLCKLRPLGLPGMHEEATLAPCRSRLAARLAQAPLDRLRSAEKLREALQNPEAPTAAVLELACIALVADGESKYKLLAEPDAARRAAMIDGELDALQSLLRRAERQLDRGAPKGCSWN
jgi:Lon protease-like protein